MGFHPVHAYYGTGDWLWSIFSTALFIGLFAVAIMLLVRVFSAPRQSGAGAAGRPVGAPPWYGPGTGSGPRSGWRTPEAEGAERILAERYARGEISEDEYQGRLEVLRRAAAPGWVQRQGPVPGAEPETPQPQWQQPEQPIQPPIQPPASAPAAAGPESGEGQDRTEEVR